MATQEVAIKQTVNITLKSDAEVLEEVVVTGYGNFKKSSFTGSASNVSTEKLQDIPTVSVQDRLAGSVSLFLKHHLCLNMHLYRVLPSLYSKQLRLHLHDYYQRLVQL
jgi:hypothetical protein